MKASLFFTLLAVPALCLADQEKKLSFIDTGFDDFVNRVLNDERERQEFKVYYNTLADRLRTADEKRRTVTFFDLYRSALTDLEQNHNNWHQEIVGFTNDWHYTLNDKFDSIRQYIKLFLTRYGAVVKYKELKVAMRTKEEETALAQNPSLWQTVKSYAVAAKTKVVNFFGFGQSTQQV